MVLIQNSIVLCQVINYLDRQNTFIPSAKLREEACRLLQQNSDFYKLVKALVFPWSFWVLYSFIFLKTLYTLYVFVMNKTINQFFVLLIRISLCVCLYLFAAGKILGAFANYQEASDILYQIANESTEDKYYNIKRQFLKIAREYEKNNIYYQAVVFYLGIYILFTVSKFLSRKTFGFWEIAIFFLFSLFFYFFVAVVLLVFFFGNPTCFLSKYLEEQEKKEQSKVETEQQEVEKIPIEEFENKPQLERKLEINGSNL